MSRILIIGYGVVGKNMAATFPEATIHDPAAGYKADGDSHYDVGFVCVPTEKLEDGSADTSIVHRVVHEWSRSVDVLCIKSTVPPGTTQSFLYEGYRVCMSPEYFGATVHAQAPKQDFVIIGGLAQDTVRVVEVYKEKFPATLQIRHTDATTAELVKYGENAFLAMKVSFVNEFARICDSFRVNFDHWRELWLLDERINPSHTFVYRDHPYYDSHCLTKDIPAIIQASIEAGYTPELLEKMEEINERRKDEEDDLW